MIISYIYVYTNSLVELDVHLSDNLFLFFLRMSVWVQKKLHERLPLAVYMFTFNQSKKQRGGTIHLFTYCQGEFTLVFIFFPLFSFFSVYLLRLAWWWWRIREYTHIQTQEYADSSLREQILYEEEGSLSIFFCT
jgi:hypothetical protein